MTYAASQHGLLRSKLSRPRVAGSAVLRPRLFDKLNRRRPLTLVVAPAGYGKTTLLSTWAATCALPVPWLALDPGDNQLALFLEYVVAALHDTLPDPDFVYNSLGAMHASPNPTAAAQLLVDQLDMADQDVVLVLDDYHTITDPAIHEFMSELVRFPAQTLNLVISSRTDPPLPLPKMRAHDQLNEVRAFELRFTGDEAARLLAQAAPSAADPDTVAILEEKTEGWVAGLQMAAMYLRSQPNPMQALQEFQGSSRYALEYLAAEVLAKQPPELERFLICTSVVDRMCASLCDAMLERTAADQASQQWLDSLVQASLFVVALDEERRWFRYHHIFQRLLQHQLRQKYTPQQIARLHRLAGSWFAERGMIDEAIPHGLAAGAASWIVELIESRRQHAMNLEEWSMLERWLYALPRQVINTYAELLVLESWLLHSREQWSEMPGRLSLAESILATLPADDSAARALRGEIAAMRSQQYYFAGEPHLAHLHAHNALDILPQEYAMGRGLAWLILGAVVLYLDSGPKALAAINKGIEEERWLRFSAAVYVRGSKAFVQWMMGDLDGLLATAEELFVFAATRNLGRSTAWAHYFRGCAYYQRNQLEAAQADFLAVLSARHVAHGMAFVQGVLGLAAVEQALGDRKGAQEAVDAVVQYAQEMSSANAKAEAAAQQAWLHLRWGEPEAACRWASSLSVAFQPTPLPNFLAPPMVLAETLLQQCTPASLDEAEILIGRLCEFTAASHNRLFEVQAWALRALLDKERGRANQAKAALLKAVQMAAPLGLVRVLADLRPALDPLLKRLQAEGSEQDFVALVLAAPTPPAAGALPEVRLDKLVQPRHPELIEPLTNRELDVLQLLALRLTNKEIGHQLGISTETVKQHSMNVFRKLNAANRRDAIVRARALGFNLDSMTAERR